MIPQASATTPPLSVVPTPAAASTAPPGASSGAASWPAPVAWAVALLVALLVAIGLRHVAWPMPPAADAVVAADQFSSARAMADVTEIARAPHPLGTPEAARVRDLLVARLSALGLSPQVQQGDALSRHDHAFAHLHNVVARLPGREPGPALLLAAHYDSASTSPGAADDGASVAAILETVRALKAGPPLRHDVVVLFTDGEEAGLLGARLFVAQHPWAHDIGAALNFEYRGDAGPVWMFDTSAHNGPLVRAWQQAVPGGLGSSLLQEIYRLMPNDTDLTAFKPAFPGLDFAAGEHYNRYHTSLDDVQGLDRGTLQQEGDAMLALTRHLGSQPWKDLRGDSLVYFDVAGLGVVSYGHAVAYALALLVVAGFVVVARLAVSRGQARTGRVAKAFGWITALCVLLAIVAQLAWLGVRQLHPGYQLLLHGSTYNDAWYFAAAGLLSAAGFLAALGRLQRRHTPLELALGALALPVLGLVATCVFMPGATFVFTWPVLPVLAGLAACLLVPALAASPARRAAVMVLACVPALLLMAPLVHLLFFALTPLLLAGTVLVIGLACCVMTPLLQPLARTRGLAPVLAVAGLAAIGGGAWTSGFDAAQPRPDYLAYVQADAAGPGYLVSDDDRLDTWTRQVLGADARRQPLPAVFGPKAEPMWARQVPPLFATMPAVDVVSDRVDGALRHVELSMHHTRPAARLAVFVDGVAVRASQVQGQPYTTHEDGHWHLFAHGTADTPLRVALDVPAGHPFSVRVRDLSYGLPPAVGPRPAGFVAQAFRSSDTLQVARTVRFE